MRIVWKDSGSVRATVKHRGYVIEGHGGGWVTNMPGDINIYRDNKSAKNAIDKHLGLYNENNERPVRHKFGIHIIGKKKITG